jgi:molybdate transport system substrate-binding protein
MTRSRKHTTGHISHWGNHNLHQYAPRQIYQQRYIKLAFLLILCLSLTACMNNYSLAFWGPGSTEGQSSTHAVTQKGGLIIQASQSLQPVIQAMQAAFFSAYHQSIPLVFDFSNAKKLVNNANTGMTVDLLITDGQQSMRDARASGIIRSDGKLLANDILTVVLPPTNPGKINTLQDLARPGLRYLAISPDSGLNGHILATLERMNLDPAFGSNYSARVSGNIVQNYTDGLVAARAIAAPNPPGDFAIVYRTDAIQVQKEQGPTALSELSIPAQFNPPVPMLAAVASQANNPSLAQQFLDFMRSPQAARIWTQFGFTPAT